MAEDEEENSEDFQPLPKRQRTEDDDDEEGNEAIDSDLVEGNECPICMERWTSHGSHRIVSLKCGHLFGKG